MLSVMLFFKTQALKHIFGILSRIEQNTLTPFSKLEKVVASGYDLKLAHAIHRDFFSAVIKMKNVLEQN